MDREHVVVTAGFVFLSIFTLTLWTFSATQMSKRRLVPVSSPPLTPSGIDDEAKKWQPINNVGSSRPPGPEPDWLIGNVRHLPKGDVYTPFCEWQKIYGDMFYLSALGKRLLVVGSLAIAEELTTKRSNVYSGRPHPTMIDDLMGWNWILTSLNPSSALTEGRRILRNALGPRKLSRYDKVLVSQLKTLVDDLDGFSGHPLAAVTNAVASTIIRIAYGDGVYEGVGKQLLELHAVTTRQLNWVAGQFWLVEYVPALKYVPEWLFGMEFQRIATEGYALQNKIRTFPCSQALIHWGQGTLGTCLVKNYFDNPQGEEQFVLVRDTIGVIHSAGVDTTSFTVIIFLSLILSHPHVQSKIHEELDALLGPTSHRLPIPADRESLPYTEAAWKEAMRLIPTLPLGVPRATMADDVYNGWHIPKDTMVFLNAGFMCRDPKLWVEPDAYKPERWLSPVNANEGALPDIYSIVFGFGSRICPGIQLADRIGFGIVTGLLSVYDLVPPEGKATPSLDSFIYEGEFARYPTNLECHFRPRRAQSPE